MKLAEMTVKQLKRRKLVAEVIGFLVSVIPVSAVIAMRWDIYTTDHGSAIKLGIGGVMVAAVVLLTVLGKMKPPGDIAVLAFLTVMFWLLRSVMDDLLLLTFMLLIGRVGDKVITNTYTKRVREEITAKDSAERAGRTIMDGVKSYLEGQKNE